MRKKISIIIFILLILISIFVLISQNIFGIIPQDFALNKFIIPIYIFLVIIIVIIFLIIIFKFAAQKPKEIVKIVHKYIEKEEEQKKQTDSKDDNIVKINKLVSDSILGLKEIKNSKKYSEKLLINLSKSFDIVQGIVFLFDSKEEVFKTNAVYAFYSEDTYKEFKMGEGITGQVAKNKKLIYIDNVPENYIKILSGLGKGSPSYLLIFPIILNNKVLGIVEFATFSPISEFSEEVFIEISEEIAVDIEHFI